VKEIIYRKGKEEKKRTVGIVFYRRYASAAVQAPPW
jgi:hypothetical protein